MGLLDERNQLQTMQEATTEYQSKACMSDAVSLLRLSGRHKYLGIMKLPDSKIYMFQPGIINLDKSPTLFSCICYFCWISSDDSSEYGIVLQRL